ncbi:MAG: TonB-dependent receptor plug domain-containing protein [Gemmatimonadota bacterium]
MRVALSAALVSAALLGLAPAGARSPAGPGRLLAQEPADTLAAPADTLAAPAEAAPPAPDTTAAPPDTLPSDGVPAPPDSLAALEDSLDALPDTTLEKLRNRTPLFPADVDPYTPLGVGPPAIVIEREELAGWPEATLADVLPSLAPLLTGDQGGPGFFQDVRFPSGLAQATRVTIDGRPLESPLGPAADLRGVPVDALERIEVRQGTSAAAGAEAGWINLVTRTHLTPQANSSLLFELGSFGREGFGAALGRWLGRRLSVFGALHFDDSATFTRVANADRSRFWLKSRLYVSRTHFLEASYGTSGVTTDTRASSPATPFTGVEDLRERRLQALYRGRVGPVLASAAFFADRFEAEESFTLEDEPLIAGAFGRRGARASGRVGIPAGVVEAGVDWWNEDPDSEAPLFDGPVGGGEEDGEPAAAAAIGRTGAFAGTELAFDSLALSIRSQVDRFESSGEAIVEPGAALELRYGTAWGLRPFARASRSARPPALAERALLVRADPTRALRVASTRELRAGTALVLGALSGEASVYDRRSEDAALWLPPTVWRGADELDDVRLASGAGEDFGDLNVLDLRTRGVDGRVRVPLPWDLVAEGFVQAQSVEDEAGREIPYVPSVQVLGRLVFDRRFFPSRNLRVRAALDGRVTGARAGVVEEQLPAYAILDGLLRVQLIGFTLGLSAENLFDRRYRTEERFFPPGRVISVEVFWEFWN